MLFFIGLTFNAQVIGITTFATGFNNPLAIVNAGDSRLFIVERGGAIKILNENGTTNATPFLQLTSSTIVSGGERGLLGLAFHPNYAQNGFFYINYTRAGDGDTVIARYSRSANNPNLADPASAQILMVIDQPFSNHNGGTIAFGPDGFLYIGMGDGGSANDPLNLSQNMNIDLTNPSRVYLGKMLRIDVNTGNPYGIPATNPYIGQAGKEEIWALGVRNPWKFSFNRLNGDMWMADVGQNAREEINKATPGEANLNYGWKCYEGNAPFSTSFCPGNPILEFPYVDYLHSTTDGCSVTGGYVYTGSLYPNLLNKYVFADYCNNQIGFVDATTPGAITWSQVFSGNPSAFGEDINGELYMATLSNGRISKIIDTTLGNQSFQSVGLQLSPNPAKDYFHLKNTALISLDKIVLTDLAGKKIQEFEGNSNIENTYYLPQTVSGLYILSVIDKNGTNYHSKLIIQ